MALLDSVVGVISIFLTIFYKLRRNDEYLLKRQVNPMESYHSNREQSNSEKYSLQERSGDEAKDYNGQLNEDGGML
jgi:hypothetical protein